MDKHTRRAFLERVGMGALAGAVGLGAMEHLGLAGGVAHADDARLAFGELEPLVAIIQETPADALLPKLKAQLDTGLTMPRLVSAAALANARTFGGHDYTGYHCFMALVPALAMSNRLEGSRAALPVFKVLHRSARRIQEKGGRSREALKPVEAAKADAIRVATLLAAGRSGDVAGAEAALLTMVAKEPKDAYVALQDLTRDNIDVHQVVLTFRSWDMLRLLGMEHADVMLRQSLRQCIDRERGRVGRGRSSPSIVALLPKLVETHALDRDKPPTKPLSDVELTELATLIFTQSRDDTAAHVAERLAKGVSRADVGEAMSLASAWLLLHDPGKKRAQAGKPVGSVHGASVGLHASDSANAWRGIGAATNPAVANASLVTGAWHTAGQSRGMDRSKPHHARAREAAAGVAPEKLLGAIGEAVKGRDQAAAAALAERYGETGGDGKALFALLIEPAIDHDGALHHEKYFLTATEEFARSRPAHRFAHLVALTRVMASGYGFEAPGVKASKALLGVE